MLRALSIVPILLLLALACPSQEPLVLLANDAPIPREELVLVSVPFPPGACTDLSGLQVEQRPTAWQPLLHWPDGSLRVAQAQFPVKPGGWLAPGEILNLRVLPGEALQGPFTPHPWVAAASLHLAVEALWEEHRARFSLEGIGVVVTETPLLRTSRFEGVLDSDTGEVLKLTVFVTAQTTAPILTLDLVVTALTECRPRHLDLVSRPHPARVQMARRHQAGTPFLDQEGQHRAPLLRECAFAPGQGKRWRLLVLVEDPEAQVLARGLARRTWQAGLQLPLRALCDAPSWQRSGALTLLGGPSFPPADWEPRVRATLGRWNLTDSFGPFGSFGLPGPPGPASAAWVWAVQTSRGRLLDLLEGFAWQQACRPNHLAEGTPFPAPEAAHGWEPFDSSGGALAHLFSYWLATGDAWSREELRHLARYALPDEQGFLQDSQLAAGLLRLWLATGEPRLLVRLRERLREVWLPSLRAKPEQTAPEASGLWGLLALWQQLDWPEAAEAIKAQVNALEDKPPPVPLAGALRRIALEKGLPEEVRIRAGALAAQADPVSEEGWNPWTFLISGCARSETGPAPPPAREQ